MSDALPWLVTAGAVLALWVALNRLMKRILPSRPDEPLDDVNPPKEPAMAQRLGSVDYEESAPDADADRQEWRKRTGTR